MIIENPTLVIWSSSFLIQAHFGCHFGERATFAKHFLPLFEAYFTHKNDTAPLKTFILTKTHALSRLLSTLIQIINSDKLVRLSRIPEVFSICRTRSLKTPSSLFPIEKDFQSNLIFIGKNLIRTCFHWK